MIIRVMVVDPAPRNPLEDVVIFHIPEKSRAHEILLEALEAQGYDFVEVRSMKKKKTEKKDERS